MPETGPADVVGSPAGELDWLSVSVGVALTLEGVVTGVLGAADVVVGAATVDGGVLVGGGGTVVLESVTIGGTEIDTDTLAEGGVVSALAAPGCPVTTMMANRNAKEMPRRTTTTLTERGLAVDIVVFFLSMDWFEVVIPNWLGHESKLYGYKAFVRAPAMGL